MALLVAPSGGYQTMRKHARSLIFVGAMASLVSGLSGCSTTSSVKPSEEATVSAPKKTGLEGLSPGMIAKIQDTEKKAKDALVQYPGTKRGMPKDLKMRPHTIPDQYVLDSEEIFAEITEDKIIVDIEGNLLMSEVNTKFSEKIKNDLFHRTILNDSFEIYDKVKYKLSRLLGGDFLLEYLSGDKPVKVAKSKDD